MSRNRIKLEIPSADRASLLSDLTNVGILLFDINLAYVLDIIESTMMNNIIKSYKRNLPICRRRGPHQGSYDTPFRRLFRRGRKSFA